VPLVKVDAAISPKTPTTSLLWKDGSPRRLGAVKDADGKISFLYENSVVFEETPEHRLEDVVDSLHADIERTNDVPTDILAMRPPRPIRCAHGVTLCTCTSRSNRRR
jgi:hypothetical protein